MTSTPDWRKTTGQFGSGYPELLEAGHQFWRTHGIPTPGASSEPSSAKTPGARPSFVVVELLAQDIRVGVRNLSIGAAISVLTGARMIAVVGTDPAWNEVVWPDYAPAELSALARAWGAVDVVDLQAAHAGTLQVDGGTYPVAEKVAMNGRRLNHIFDASLARVLKVPRLGREHRAGEVAKKLRTSAEHSTRIWEALFDHLRPEAFVTSHVDYTPWAPAVSAASRVGTPTLHVQSTGGLKSYYGIERSGRRRHSYRRQLTRDLGAFFEKELWPNRDRLAAPSDVVAWRARQNLGVPAWWRRDGEDDTVIMSSRAERASVRQWTAKRRELDPNKPIVAVFAHAVSDALDGNHEAFDSLSEWFSWTADFAADHDEVQWLFLDHPRQDYYDVSGEFETVAQAHREHRHTHFMPSTDLTKSELWALADLVVTVRGSVSNEFPAFGTPALQAGWSEWSHCGFTMRADTRRQYKRLLTTSLSRLTSGAELMTADQVRRARLWMWFYRSGSDVQTPLVPHWNLDNQQRMRSELTFALAQSENDADPLFTRVASWLRHPTPALMRCEPSDYGVGHRRREWVLEDPMSTLVDIPHTEATQGDRITSTTTDPRVRLISGWAAGTAVVGRLTHERGTLAVSAGTEHAVRVTVQLRVDGTTQQWRRDRGGVETPDAGTRSVTVSIGGEPRTTVEFPELTAEEPAHTVEAVLDLPRGALPPGGLLMLDVGPAETTEVSHPALGVELVAIELGDAAPAQITR